MKKNVIVSLADANYFDLLLELVESVKSFKESSEVAICILDAGLTKEQLDDWGCRYHDLRVGKPHYDLWIDDKSKRIEEI